MRVLITGAWSELETRGLTSAVAMLREARGRAATLGDDVLLALSRVQEGVVLAHAGDWDAAISALGLVGDGAAALTPAQRCAFHINLGLALTGAGRITEAADALETARDLAHDHGFVEQEFKARHNLACLAFVDGDLPRALVLMRQADEMTATVARDRARLDHAEVLLAAGLVDGARSALEDALTGAQRQAHRLEEGEISLRLARCDLLVGDLGGARRHVGQALAAYRSRQADELVQEAQLIRHTLDVAEGHDLPSVVTALARRTDRDASAVSTRPSDRAALRLEAEARITLGDLDGAERRLAALDGSDESSLAATLHDVLVRARLDRARGRAAEAVARLEAGNRILAAHQFQSASLDVRAALALHGRRLSALDVERSLAEDGPDEVLGTVERWRAISHRINPVTPSVDAELAAATRELRRLRRISADSDPDTAATLAPRIGDLEAQVAHREWSLAVHGSGADPGNPVSPEEAHAAVSAAGATAVEFVETGDLLVQLVVRPTGTEVVDVGTVPEVVAAVTRLRRDLRARAGVAAASPMAAALERATASSLAAVDRLLNPSGASDGRVVLVPSHSLAGMPWSLMPSLRGRPVTTAPSLTRWVRGPAAPADARRLGVAALHGPGLGRTAPEIRAVLAAHGSPVPVDVHPASSEEVLTALASTRIVHLAAHGTHQRQSPLFSSLRMADGPLFAHEFPRPVAAEHVVLSACDVGQFSTRAGDEPLGLAIALLALGATSVLAAVAPVADDVAHDAMVAYHRMIAAGTDAAEALAVVIEGEPAAGVFCLYGSDWAAGGAVGLR